MDFLAGHYQMAKIFKKHINLTQSAETSLDVVWNHSVTSDWVFLLRYCKKSSSTLFFPPNTWFQEPSVSILLTNDPFSIWFAGAICCSFLKIKYHYFLDKIWIIILYNPQSPRLHAQRYINLFNYLKEGNDSS